VCRRQATARPDGGGLTFSATHLKCTDRQNLLCSTLAPGVALVLSSRALNACPCVA